ASFRSGPKGLMRLIDQSSRICWALLRRSSMALMTTPTTRLFGERTARVNSSPTTPRVPSVSSFFWKSTGGGGTGAQGPTASVAALPKRRVRLEVAFLYCRVTLRQLAGQQARAGVARNARHRGDHGSGHERRAVEGGLEPMVLADVAEQFVAHRPTHAVEDEE